MDAFELMLIRPILRATSLKQVRARSRAARAKLARYEKATRMSVGDAVTVYDRIKTAERQATEGVGDEARAQEMYRFMETEVKAGRFPYRQKLT